MRVDDDRTSPTLDARTEGGQEPAPHIRLIPSPRKEEPQLPVQAGETALAVPERDPERIAFNLWNEGRIDEAIAFLEREIAAEKDRSNGPSRRKLSRARKKILGDVEEASGDAPVEPRRRRVRTLDGADFTATGAPVGQIDLVAMPTDRVQFTTRRRIWPAAAAILILAAAGFAGATYFYGADRSGVDTTLPVTTLPDAPAETASITQAPAASGADDEAPGAADPEELIELPPPEEDAAAEAPPAESGTGGAGADEQAVELAAAEPVESLPPEEATGLAALSPDDAADGAAGAESFGPEGTPVETARLPRQRPEPTAEDLRSAARAARPERREEPQIPLVLGAPPAPLQAPRDLAGTSGAPLPVYGRPPAEDPYYGPVRPRLSPEEHEALLERRELAEEYLARRRAQAEDYDEERYADEEQYAEEDYAEDDGREYRIIGRILPPWRRLGF